MDELAERLVSNVITTGGHGNQEVAVARVLSAPGIEVQSSVWGSFLK